MDIRENLDDSIEEVLRATIAGMLKNVWTSMPSRITKDTKDGHVATAQPTIKLATTDPETGVTTYQDHPDHVDVPIHHMGGGGVSKTFPTKQADTGLIIYAARALDAWFQSDGTQQPMEDRVHSIEDGTFLSGIRSIPRALKQVAKDSAQGRSDDLHHVVDLHPVNGHHVKSVDPSTPVASDNFNPFTQATKFFNRILHPVNGHAHNAVDGDTTHTLSLDHIIGHVMSVVNGLHKITSHPTDGLAMLAKNATHSVLAHPEDGASMNASNLLHKVLAHPSLGSLLSAAGGAHMVQAHPSAGVQVKSATAVSIQSAGPLSLSAPPGMLSLPTGGVSGASLSVGAAAGNVGALGGDLSGTLPNPRVIGITHVQNADTLPAAADDGAASASGVVIGGLYRNTAALAGVSLLAVRMH